MKTYYFFVDDNIWFLRDLAKERPTSLFDHPYLKLFKQMHQKYGMKVQMNIFYQTHPKSDPLGEAGAFSLKEMPDCYKSEWKENAHWLKLAFHAKAEFPDIPFINITYDEMIFVFSRVRDEIIRFAGEDSFCYSHMVPHWNCVSLGGCKALEYLGVQSMVGTHGDVLPENADLSSISKAHIERLMQNRTEPSSWVYHHKYSDVDTLRLKGYNHISNEELQRQDGTKKYFMDENIGMKFKATCKFALDRCTPEQIVKYLNEDIDKEYIGFGLHEQYFYPKYHNYQPNYAEKVEMAVRIMNENNFKSVFYDEIL